MQPWVFSDGTKVWLGGKVEGDSDLAEEVRIVVKLTRTRGRVNSGYGPPCGEELLDPDVDYLMDFWLRSLSAIVVSAPHVVYPEQVPAVGGDTSRLY
jgi:hypothetical protein